MAIIAESGEGTMDDLRAGSQMDVTFRSNVAKTLECCSKTTLPEFVAGSQRQPAADAGNGVRPAPRNHPSTRAGGQDDVSSEQTPSNEGDREFPWEFPWELIKLINLMNS